MDELVSTPHFRSVLQSLSVPRAWSECTHMFVIPCCIRHVGRFPRSAPPLRFPLYILKQRVDSLGTADAVLARVLAPSTQ